jgi:hypothetical protein
MEPRSNQGAMRRSGLGQGPSTTSNLNAETQDAAH